MRNEQSYQLSLGHDNNPSRITNKPRKITVSSEYCSPALRDFVFFRAQGMCQCTQSGCHAQLYPGARCFKPLVKGDWDVHRLLAGGAYSPENTQAMCKQCHQNTPSYGVGR